MVSWVRVVGFISGRCSDFAPGWLDGVLIFRALSGGETLQVISNLFSWERRSSHFDRARGQDRRE